MSHKEYLQQIGLEVRVARIRKRITQPELSRITGVSVNTISDVELGYVDFHILIFKRIVDALGIQMKDIL